MFVYSVDKMSKVSLKDQVAAILRDRIQQGIFQPGERIPSEFELVELFDVSRNTIRLAVDQLVGEGLLIRQRPKGVFVTENLSGETFNSILSFSNEILRLGKQPGAKVLAKRETVLSDRLQQKYGLPAEPVYEIYRLRMADEAPVALERSVIIKACCLGLLEHDLSQSLYGLLQRNYDLRFTHAKQRFGAVILTADESRLLGTEAGTEGLLLTRITYLSGEQVVEILESVYRADLYEFELELTRANIHDTGIILRPIFGGQRFEG